MQLGEFVEKMTPSDRLVVINAEGQTIYRGYVANFNYADIRPTRLIKRFGISMETYKKTEIMWDWKNTAKLPDQIPVESLSQFDIGQLQQLVYTKVVLEN